MTMNPNSKRALGTVFYVPNDRCGQAFIENLRFYLNRGIYKLTVRGRNEDRKQFRKERSVRSLREFIPKRMASYFAVYIDSPVLQQLSRDSNKQLYDELRQLQRELRENRKSQDAKTLKKLTNQLFNTRRALAFREPN